MTRRRYLAWIGAAALSASSASVPGARAHAPEAVGVESQEIPSRFAIDDDDPEGSVPSHADAMKQPLEMGYFVMTLSERAEAAEQRGDHGAALKYYRALGKAVPDRAVAFARACRLYERIGAREQAVEQCRLALGKDGTKVTDHARLVRLMLARPGALPVEEIADIDAVLSHLERETAALAAGSRPGTAASSIVHELRCELGARLRDVTRLSSCADALTKIAPDAPRTLVFRFALAVARGDLDAAEGLIAQARGAGLPGAALASMRERLSSERERMSLAARLSRGELGWLAAPVCFALAALALLALLALLARGPLRGRTRTRTTPGRTA